MKCEICGQDIPEERLEAVSETVLCIEHAKAGSLKNYGDVDVHKKHNDEALHKLCQEYESAKEG